MSDGPMFIRKSKICSLIFTAGRNDVCVLQWGKKEKNFGSLGSDLEWNKRGRRVFRLRTKAEQLHQPWYTRRIHQSKQVPLSTSFWKLHFSLQEIDHSDGSSFSSICLFPGNVGLICLKVTKPTKVHIRRISGTVQLLVTKPVTHLSLKPTPVSGRLFIQDLGWSLDCAQTGDNGCAVCFFDMWPQPKWMVTFDTCFWYSSLFSLTW